MEVKFKKMVEFSYEFNPQEIADIAVKDYIEDNGCLDSYIQDYICDNLYQFLQEAGLSDEDLDAIMDMDMEGVDVTEELEEEVIKLVNDQNNLWWK